MTKILHYCVIQGWASTIKNLLFCPVRHPARGSHLHLGGSFTSLAFVEIPSFIFFIIARPLFLGLPSCRHNFHTNVVMSTTAPQDGGTNMEHLKDRLKHPFSGSGSSKASGDGESDHEHLKYKLKHPFSDLRDKFRDSKLHDLKVGLIHKK